MRNILITGGTAFVSKYLASYFVNKNENVYVFNRNNNKQVNGVTLIKGDKSIECTQLKSYTFDLVIAVNIYNVKEMKNLINGLTNIKDFVFISSSAVYPETTPLPFKETDKIGFNSIWQQYGYDKCEAEKYLSKTIPQAYIIRPPYLYGKYKNLYREGFVFDCAMNNLPFYIPKDGKMLLQFFNVQDLCVFIDTLLIERPSDHIFNVGNTELININQYIEICYDIVGTKLKKIHVDATHNQRSYFPFYDYEYYLDVTKQSILLPKTISIYDGLKTSYDWYKKNQNKIHKKDYLKYINEYLTI